MNAFILLEGGILTYLPLKFEIDVKTKAIIDTGAFASAMPADFDEKQGNIAEFTLRITASFFLNVKVASGRHVKVLD